VRFRNPFSRAHRWLKTEPRSAIQVLCTRLVPGNTNIHELSFSNKSRLLAYNVIADILHNITCRYDNHSVLNNKEIP
jgi:hypothetical protein